MPSPSLQMCPDIFLLNAQHFRNTKLLLVLQMYLMFQATLLAHVSLSVWNCLPCFLHLDNCFSSCVILDITSSGSLSCSFTRWVRVLVRALPHWVSLYSAHTTLYQNQLYMTVMSLGTGMYLCICCKLYSPVHTAGIQHFFFFCLKYNELD